MGKILVTGASGHIGRLTLQHLLKRNVPAGDLIGLVRDRAKAADLAALKIELREGNYDDKASLVRALQGVEKVMLVSTLAFIDRKSQHGNVIDAAVEAGVKHIVYMPIIRKPGSGFVMKEVTDEDIFTEKKIVESGLKYTFVKHPPYLETMYTGGPNVIQSGLRVPVGSGKTAGATRDNLAEAHAVVLTEPGHENKSYNLTGNPAVSYADMAALLTEISGRDVPLIPISDQEFIASMTAAGLPDFVATFVLSWVDGINRGEWDQVTNDLERLIGHKPTTTKEFFRTLYAR